MDLNHLDKLAFCDTDNCVYRFEIWGGVSESGILEFDIHEEEPARLAAEVP